MFMNMLKKKYCVNTNSSSSKEEQVMVTHFEDQIKDNTGNSVILSLQPYVYELSLYSHTNGTRAHAKSINGESRKNTKLAINQNAINSFQADRESGLSGHTDNNSGHHAEISDNGMGTGPTLCKNLERNGFSHSNGNITQEFDEKLLTRETMQINGHEKQCLDTLAVNNKHTSDSKLHHSTSKSSILTTEERSTRGGLLWLFPLFSALILPIMSIVTYGMAVANGHVEAFLPSVSMIWEKSPESSVFGLTLSLYSIIGGLTLYIRFQQVSEHINPEKTKLRLLNRSSFIVAMLTLLAGIVTGHFSVGTIDVVHYTSACCLLALATVYNLLQAILSIWVGNIPGCGRKTRIFRLVSAILQSILGIAYIGLWAGHWRYPDLFLIANIVEWIDVFLLTTYQLTFLKEFTYLFLSTTIGQRKSCSEQPYVDVAVVTQ